MESVFLIVICCSTAALGALIWANARNNFRYPIFLTMFLTFTSAPLIFAIDRGGTDMILFPLIVLAVLLHSDERHKFAQILLSITAVLKIVPAIYMLIYVGRGKSFKKVFKILGSVLLLNLAAAAIMPEKGISELWFFAKDMVGRGSGSTVLNNYDVFNNSLWTSFRGLTLALLYFGIDASSFLKTTWLVSIICLLIFSIYWCLLRSKLDSSKFFIANCLLLLIPTIAGNYRLLFMYPSLWYLSNSITFPNVKLQRIFVVASAMLLSISPIYYFGSTGINIGQAMKPFLILTLLLIVCYSDEYQKVKLSKQDQYENTVTI